MDKKKKIIIVAVILVITAAALAWVFTRPEKTDNNPQNENNQTETTQPQETQKPEETQTQEESQEPQSEQQTDTTQTTSPKAAECTVMYIYSDSDNDKDKNLEMMENVKKDYAGKANFNVMNINDEFAQMTGFALPDETPKLIVITEDGGFSQIANCSDETAIRQEIDKFVK